MADSDFQKTSLALIEESISRVLSHEYPDQRQRLQDAMKYSACDAGKRLRPLLALATHDLFSSEPQKMLPVAVAIELVHCFSLVHDDLPAMDDDDLRRGKPSCHKAFDEASAILCGDALLALAFEHLAEALPRYFDDKQVLTAIIHLGKAVGSQGLIGGQILDMGKVSENATEKTLETMHQAKTGALISISLTLPALLNHAEVALQKTLAQFGTHLGLLFQIRDDILDEDQSTEQLGKTQGKDSQQNKVTYVTLLGREKAKFAFDQEKKAAFQQLNSLKEDTTALEDLLNRICQGL
ncbi:MAG: farnesyl diphosphate synthase [bacterium]